MTPDINPSDYLVLVCDDEEAIRSMLAQAIGGWGFQVATSPNAEMALDYMKAGNIPHILLTDVRMGDMNGLELAAEVKRLSNEIEVIIMTSYGTFETAVQAMRLGVFDYISKPFDNIDDVRTTLVHVAERIYMRFYTEYLVDELQRKNLEIERLSNISNELSRTLDLAKTIEIGVTGISEAFDISPTAFVQFVPSLKSLMITTRQPKNLFGEGQLVFPLPEDVATSSKKTSTYIKELGNNSEFLLFLEQAWSMNPPEVPKLKPNVVPQWKVEPLVTRDVPRGVFVCLPAQWKDPESTNLLHRYIQTVSTAFENALLHAKVVQTAIRDSLTGLYNVRYFKERFSQEVQSALRVKHPVSLLFFDVDHFKKYNDTHGHPAGDGVLKKAAALMRKAFRATDVLARYGGEEFVVAMPHTAFVDALAKAEKFRQLLEDTPFPNGHTQPLGKVTISVGVAEFPSHGADIDSVIKAADEALYDAKKKSRNVVVAATAPVGYVPAYVSKSIRTRDVGGESGGPSGSQTTESSTLESTPAISVPIGPTATPAPTKTPSTVIKSSMSPSQAASSVKSSSVAPPGKVSVTPATSPTKTSASVPKKNPL